jgi:uncharacterized protein
MHMANLDRRMQILIDEERHQRLEQRATAEGRPVAALVREAIDLAFPSQDDERRQAGASFLSRTPMPVGDWDDEAGDPGRHGTRTLSIRFLYDTPVFLYALGVEHRYRAPCREIVRLAAAGRLLGDASVELVQEFVHVRARRREGRGEAAAAGREVSAMCRLHPLEADDLRLGLDLFEQSGRLQMREALHAATALNRGIGLIVTTDRAFEGLPGLERVDPLDAAARLQA